MKTNTDNITDIELVAMFDGFISESPDLYFAIGRVRTVINDGKADITNVFRKEDFDYDRNWNTLISVIRKWSKIKDVENLAYFLHLTGKIDDALQTYDIDKTYNLVVESIKWYDNQY